MATRRQSPEWALRDDALTRLRAVLEGLHRAVAAGFALPRLASGRAGVDDPFGYSTNVGGGLNLPGAFVDSAIEDLCRSDSDCQRNFDALLTRSALSAAHELFKEYLGIGYSDHTREQDLKEFNDSKLGSIGWEMRDIVSHSAAGQKHAEASHTEWFIEIKEGNPLSIQCGSVLAYMGELDRLAQNRFTGQ